MHFVCSFYKKKITVILIFNYYELLFLDIFFRIYFRPLFWRALMYFTKVIIFYLVRFLLKKIIKSILKKKQKLNRYQFKPTGFSLVILEQKPVHIGLVRFFLIWLRFFLFLFCSVFLVSNL